MIEEMFEEFVFDKQTEEIAKPEEVAEVANEFKEWQEKLGFEFEKIEDIPTKVLSKFLNNINPELKDVAELMFLGKDVSKQELQKLLTFSDESTEFSNEADARVFLRNKLVDSFGEDGIDDYLDTLEDKNKILEKASELKQKDLEASKNKMKGEIEIRNKEKQEKDLSFLKELNKEFEELKWSDNVKQKVVEISPPEKSNEILNRIYSDPKSYLQFLSILASYKDGKFDLDTFVTQKDSKAIKETKEKLEKRQGEFVEGKNKTTQDPASFLMYFE